MSKKKVTHGRHNGSGCPRAEGFSLQELAKGLHRTSWFLTKRQYGKAMPNRHCKE